MQSDRSLHDPIKLNLCRVFTNAINDIRSNCSSRNFTSLSENSASNLCIVIEAIFLHGFRQSLITKTRSLFVNDEKNTIHFWNFLLLLTHKHTIQQIDNLKLINNEIGKCRAWIRIALNESMLSSYINLIRSNSETVSKHYRSYAFLTDSNSIDLIEKLILPIEKRERIFAFNTSSSLLNKWLPKTLALAGILNQTLRLPKNEISISEAIDVAEYIEEFEKESESNSMTVIGIEKPSVRRAQQPQSDNASVSSATGDTSASDFGTQFDPLLASSPLNSSQSSYKTADAAAAAASSTTNTTITSDPNNSSRSYANVLKSSNPSVPIRFSELARSKENDAAKKSNTIVNTPSDADDELDYSELIDSYRNDAGDEDLKNRVKQIHNAFVIEGDEDGDNGENCLGSAKRERGFEDSLRQCLFQLPKNNGLKHQNSECDRCKRSLLNKYFLCHFTNKYFCDNCMSKRNELIPSRILYNWDCLRRSVSVDAAQYLDENRSKGLFDLSVWNSLIYEKVQIMSAIHEMRQKLILVGEYLFTCRSSKEKIGRSIRNNHDSYIYTNVHLFSIKDFEMIVDGYYLKTYTAILNKKIEHISQCFFCTQRGYFCEICSNDRIIFPYDFKNNYLCNACHGVFHKSCFHAKKNCPKCKRKKKFSVKD